MEIPLFTSLQSEWLKRKRSAAAWLTVIGGFFIPAIVLMVRFNDFSTLATQNASEHLWDTIYQRSWQFMGVFLLPMGVIMATSLVTQLEFRNNTWKQLHSTPQSFTTIFMAKLLVILFMLLQFFILFNIGIYFTGVIPALFEGVPFPKQPLTAGYIFSQNAKYFIACLPIVALQYLLSLRFKNFLVSIGAGLCLLVASLIALSWKHGYLIPYSYCGYGFLGKKLLAGINTNLWALAYFVLFTVLGYILYIKRREKG